MITINTEVVIPEGIDITSEYISLVLVPTIKEAMNSESSESYNEAEDGTIISVKVWR